jgi:hypothetical protein
MKNRCPVCNKREAHCDYCCTPALRALVRAAVEMYQDPEASDQPLCRAVARYLAEKKKKARRG